MLCDAQCKCSEMKDAYTDATQPSWLSICLSTVLNFSSNSFLIVAGSLSFQNQYQKPRLDMVVNCNK